MLATRNLVWLGFMVLLVSAMLTPQMAVALEVAPTASQAAFGQPLPDGTLKDLNGRYSLSNFGNGLTNVVVQINQPGTPYQTNSASITYNNVPVVDTKQVGAAGTPLDSGGFVITTPLDTQGVKAFGTLMGLFTFKR